MKNLLKKAFAVMGVVCLIGLLAGCTVVLQKRHTTDVKEIESLSQQVKRLKMSEEEYLKLKDAYVALEKGLKKEIVEKKVVLEIEPKGLVITIVESVLFASGKVKIRREAHKTLDKVASVCRRTVKDREVGIEGHTDNRPIKYSGWKSNWELSTARATSVLHYLQKKGISPERLSATGFGEYRPVASNWTKEGRQKNRRVEIVILPKKIIRTKEQPPKARGKYKK